MSIDRKNMLLNSGLFISSLLIGSALLLTRRRSLYLRILRLEKTNPDVWPAVKSALDTIHETYLKYRNEEIAMAFNGGKDCLVVFLLVLAYCQHHPSTAKMPFLVYFEREDEFSEMMEFMHETIRRYQLEIYTAKGGFQNGLETMKAQKGIKAIFMGQRKCDPYAPPSIFAMTTKGWPEMMRINPILQWDYKDVWRFIKGTNVRYCCLYDQGYTSLGPKSRTMRNEKLLSEGPEQGYRPAHELDTTDGDEGERSGRVGSQIVA